MQTDHGGQSVNILICYVVVNFSPEFSRTDCTGTVAKPPSTQGSLGTTVLTSEKKMQLMGEKFIVKGL
jgi:hypothetical protein